jgi:AraC family transcriptional regulator
MDQDQGAFGRGLGRAFGLADPPTLSTFTRRNRRLAVTQIRHDVPGFGRAQSIPAENAYLVALQLRDCAGHGLSIGGKRVATKPLAAGDALFYDLRRDPVAEFHAPFHALYFYLPRAAFDEVADEAALPRIGDLRYEPGIGVSDAVLWHMGATLLPSFEVCERPCRPLIDHVLRAICTHVAHVYGGMPNHAPRRGGLAPWQERRAKELLSASIHGAISLAQLAQECDLSLSHFARAFRRSTGVPPHSWLVAKRVERAKQLLSGSSLSLSELALAAGFADQSHLTRSFKREVGTTPGTWRRMYRAEGHHGQPIVRGGAGAYGPGLGCAFGFADAPTLTKLGLPGADLEAPRTGGAS